MDTTPTQDHLNIAQTGIAALGAALLNALDPSGGTSKGFLQGYKSRVETPKVAKAPKVQAVTPEVRAPYAVPVVAPAFSPDVQAYTAGLKTDMNPATGDSILDTVANDKRVWSEAEPTILGLSQALEASKGQFNPEVAIALKRAMPQLRQYAAANTDNLAAQKKIMTLINLYGQSLGGN